MSLSIILARGTVMSASVDNPSLSDVLTLMDSNASTSWMIVSAFMMTYVIIRMSKRQDQCGLVNLYRVHP